MAQVQRQPISREPVEGTITVTQVRSSIANKPKTRATIIALGLGTIGDSNVLPDRPEIRGMIARVPHLVNVVVNTSSHNTSSQNTSSTEG
jgi:large subunit ribosomal protein L30